MYDQISEIIVLIILIFLLSVFSDCNDQQTEFFLYKLEWSVFMLYFSSV